MSRAGTVDGLDELPDTVVRAREGPTKKKLHRQDPDSDDADPRPVCKFAQAEREYGLVETVVYRGFLKDRLCRDPACFGEGSR